jgi:glycine C-acetyltransferase
MTAIGSKMSSPVSQEDVQRASESGALRRSLAHYARPKGRDLLERLEPFYEWQQSRRLSRAWPYARSLDAAPKAETSIRYDDGHISSGMNFASQDYLSLASHPAVSEGALRALRTFGPHSAGSPNLLGNTSLSLE